MLSSFETLRRYWVGEFGLCLWNDSERSYSERCSREMFRCGVPLWLCRTYGLRISDDRSKTGPACRGLIIRRPGSPVYMRDNTGIVVRGLMRKIIKRHILVDPGRQDSYFLVNTPIVVERLNRLCGEEYKQLVSEAEIGHSCGSGLLILRVVFDREPGSSDLELVNQFTRLLQRIGATPSLYSVYRVAYGEEITETPEILDVESEECLQRIQIAVAKVPEEEEASTGRLLVLRTAMQILGGFLRFGDFEGHFDESLPIQWQLRHLSLLAETVGYAMRDQVDEFPWLTSLDFAMSLLELVADDVFVLMSLLRPVDSQAVHEAVSSLLRIRHGIPSDWLSEDSIFLSSSGMDSLGSAIAACQQQAGMDVTIERVDEAMDYLELTYMLNDNSAKGLSSEYRILVANMAPSAPQQSVLAASTLIELIRSHPNRRQMLILDITLDTPEKDLHALVVGVGDLLRSARLLILCCKSLCKYATFGTAKIQGGFVAVVGLLDSFPAVGDLLRRHARALAWHDTPDMQVMALFAHAAPNAELELVGSASKNAAVVHSMMPSSVMCSPKLPFIVRSRSGVGAVRIPVKRLKSDSLVEFVPRLPFEERDSFSSITSAFLHMSNCIRWNVGQESPSELKEKFWALGKLLHAADRSFKEQDMSDDAFPFELTLDWCCSEFVVEDSACAASVCVLGSTVFSCDHLSRCFGWCDQVDGLDCSHVSYRTRLMVERHKICLRLLNGKGPTPTPSLPLYLRLHILFSLGPKLDVDASAALALADNRHAWLQWCFEFQDFSSLDSCLCLVILQRLDGSSKRSSSSIAEGIPSALQIILDVLRRVLSESSSSSARWLKHDQIEQRIDRLAMVVSDLEKANAERKVVRAEQCLRREEAILRFLQVVASVAESSDEDRAESVASLVASVETVMETKLEVGPQFIVDRIQIKSSEIEMSPKSTRLLSSLLHELQWKLVVLMRNQVKAIFLSEEKWKNSEEDEEEGEG